MQSATRNFYDQEEMTPHRHLLFLYHNTDCVPCCESVTVVEIFFKSLTVTLMVVCEAFFTRRQ